jgi:hypothetical protein
MAGLFAPKGLALVSRGQRGCIGRTAMKISRGLGSLGFLALAVQLFALPAAAQTAATAKPAYFLVQVQRETFILAVTDPKAIADATDCLEGRKRLIPTGEVTMGDGGFNTGYGWHLKPETVRLVEIAMEVCDGLPSDVGNITSKRYCPWTARFSKRLPDKN